MKRKVVLKVVPVNNQYKKLVKSISITIAVDFKSGIAKKEAEEQMAALSKGIDIFNACGHGFKMSIPKKKK